MTKAIIIICNNQDKEEISNILGRFIKNKTGDFKKRKYSYANQLINFKKSDLETAKADIEFSIDSQRTFASTVAISGTLITAYLLLENVKPEITILSTIFFAAIGTFLYFNVSGKIALLHVVKIALAKKSEIKNSNNVENPDLLKTIIRTERGLTIAGTRITIYDVMDYVTKQYSPEFIRSILSLTDDQVNAALSYIEINRADVEAEYQIVLKEAKELQNYWEERNRELFAKIATQPPKPGTEAAWAKLQAEKAKLESKS